MIKQRIAAIERVTAPSKEEYEEATDRNYKRSVFGIDTADREETADILSAMQGIYKQPAIRYTKWRVCYYYKDNLIVLLG